MLTHVFHNVRRCSHWEDTWFSVSSSLRSVTTITTSHAEWRHGWHVTRFSSLDWLRVHTHHPTHRSWARINWLLMVFLVKLVMCRCYNMQGDIRTGDTISHHHRCRQHQECRGPDSRSSVNSLLPLNIACWDLSAMCFTSKPVYLHEPTHGSVFTHKCIHNAAHPHTHPYPREFIVCTTESETYCLINHSLDSCTRVYSLA